MGVVVAQRLLVHLFLAVVFGESVQDLPRGGGLRLMTGAAACFVCLLGDTHSAGAWAGLFFFSFGQMERHGNRVWETPSPSSRAGGAAVAALRCSLLTCCRPGSGEVESTPGFLFRQCPPCSCSFPYRERQTPFEILTAFCLCLCQGFV